MHSLTAAILAGMEITGLGWCGTRPGGRCELAPSRGHVPGLRAKDGQGQSLPAGPVPVTSGQQAQARAGPG